MNLFRGIFRRRPAASAKPAATQAASAPRAASLGDSPSDFAIDDSLLAISRELSGLASVEVSPAAKERGWASLESELERRPVRAAGQLAAAGAAGSRGATRRASAHPAHSRSWRWAIGSAAAIVAVIAALLGTWGGGLLQTAGNDNHDSTTVSVVSSDSTEPVTTVSTDGTTPGTVGPAPTGVEPTTTLGPGGTETSGGASSTTASTPATSAGSGGPTTTKPASPPTTKPASPTTMYAAGEKEGSAVAVAKYLADMVITGNTSGARALVASDPEAQSSLAQMRMSLNEPYGYTFPQVQSVSADTVRVTFAINDRVDNGQGQLVEVLKHFVVKVRVQDGEAVVIAINAGS
jgi:hypothetical protein